MWHVGETPGLASTSCLKGHREGRHPILTKGQREVGAGGSQAGLVWSREVQVEWSAVPKAERELSSSV